ncbi:YkvA family protein [Cohnella candidum]|uniref:DUF1232 domain-containing protein n=1 Tax=Cohnella candidum TaxID=2674991 RepID=A0A3G3JVL0_9BACL|nr:YkvA family protein [Cohnella candidum]AYQ72266.1 DUF1232 domain-containing protein [Cohnella candidum]
MALLPERLIRAARKLKRDSYILYLCCRDGRTPWYAKLFAICVAAYAFSPIDLIPDFIPVLGYLDDLILVPLGVLIAIRMVPKEVVQDCRARAEEEFRRTGKPKNWIAGGIIVVLWAAFAVWLIVFLSRLSF